MPAGDGMDVVYRYRAWDGTQDVEPLEPQQVLAALADSLLAGNIDQAFDRALHRGLTGPEGESLDGLDQLRDRLRAERRRLQQVIADDESLRRLADALRAGAAGGNEPLDPESQQLLDALAANPGAARRILSQLDAETRSPIESALGEIRSSGEMTGSDELARTPAFGGTLNVALSRLDALNELEQRMRNVRQIADVGEIDPELIRELLGGEAAVRFERLAASLRVFAESGYVRGPGGKRELSARALQHIGEELLSTTLERLKSRQGGDRLLADQGDSHDLAGTSRDYRFGDPLTLDLSRTVLQAVRRGPGVPVRIAPTDFAIFEREPSARAATVLAIDLSRSMGERGYLLAAKQLALALQTLIRTRFPRDKLLLTGFSETAKTLTPRELPRLNWDRYGYGTNIQDALRLGRSLLAAHRGLQRNLILLTDGEPTAHKDASGKVHFGHPPFPETLVATYAEADRLRREDISLFVCVLSNQFQVVRFARELTQRAAGQLIVTSPDDLSAAVILRYGHHRRRP